MSLRVILRPVAGVLVLAVSPVGWAHSEQLTWDATVREALASNPALAAAREDVAAAKAGVWIAASDFLPGVSADGGLNRGGSRPLDRDWQPAGPESESTSYSLGGSASLNIFKGGASWASYKRARAVLTRSRESYRQTSQGLRWSLRQSWNRLVYDMRNIELLTSIKERLNRDTRYLEIQFKSGHEPRWTFLKAMGDEASIAWQLAQAKLALISDRRDIARFLGRDPDSATALEASGELSTAASPDDASGLYALMERTHPAFLIEEAAIQSAEAGVTQAMSVWWPSIGTRASYDWSDAGAWPPSRSSWSAGVTVSLPLFSGGGDWFAVSQARHSLFSEQKNRDDLRASLRDQLFGAWASFRSTYDRMPVLKLGSEMADERFKTVQALYESGRAAYLDFDQADSALTQAQQQLLSGKLALSQSKTDYDKALGLTLEDEGAEKP